MNQTCAISSNKCTRAAKDRAIFSDDRVIRNLLESEVSYVPNCDYFGQVQDDIQPFMRKVVTTWMLEWWFLQGSLLDLSVLKVAKVSNSTHHQASYKDFLNLRSNFAVIIYADDKFDIYFLRNM
ncbi:hypothetical protein HUJ04_009658 [Dendroctonus ponderosae]|nr:hypothetical protein HUJ04_009658 [Dendroctonus ponderosae]